MTKSKKTQAQLLEEISFKLTAIIDQLNEILNYKPPVQDDNVEGQYSEESVNNSGDYYGTFGTVSERKLDA